MLSFLQNPAGQRNMVVEMLLQMPKKFPDVPFFQKYTKEYIRELYNNMEQSFLGNTNALDFYFRAYRFIVTLDTLIDRSYPQHSDWQSIRDNKILRKWGKQVGLDTSTFTDRELDPKIGVINWDSTLVSFTESMNHLISVGESNNFSSITDYDYTGAIQERGLSLFKILQELEFFEDEELERRNEEIKSGKRPNLFDKKDLDWGDHVIEFLDGFFWERLDVGKSDKEGGAMGHCGNTAEYKPSHKIYSLRRFHKIKKGGAEIIKYSVHLTFVMWEIEYKTGNKKLVSKKIPSKVGPKEGFGWSSYYVDYNYDINEFVDDKLNKALPKDHPAKEIKKKRTRKQPWRRINKLEDEKKVIRILGESKAFGNSKPKEEHHPYIFALLDSEYCDLNIGGGYDPDSNFRVADLTEEQREVLFYKKPHLKDLNVFLDNSPASIRDTLAQLIYEIIYNEFSEETQETGVPSVSVASSVKDIDIYKRFTKRQFVDVGSSQVRSSILSNIFRSSRADEVGEWLSSKTSPYEIYLLAGYNPLELAKAIVKINKEATAVENTDFDLPVNSKFRKFTSYDDYVFMLHMTFLRGSTGDEISVPPSFSIKPWGNTYNISTYHTKNADKFYIPDIEVWDILPFDYNTGFNFLLNLEKQVDIDKIFKKKTVKSLFSTLDNLISQLSGYILPKGISPYGSDKIASYHLLSGNYIKNIRRKNWYFTFSGERIPQSFERKFKSYEIDSSIIKDSQNKLLQDWNLDEFIEFSKLTFKDLNSKDISDEYHEFVEQLDPNKLTKYMKFFVCFFTIKLNSLASINSQGSKYFHSRKMGEHTWPGIETYFQFKKFIDGMSYKSTYKFFTDEGKFLIQDELSKYSDNLSKISVNKKKDRVVAEEKREKLREEHIKELQRLFKKFEIKKPKRNGEDSLSMLELHLKRDPKEELDVKLELAKSSPEYFQEINYPDELYRLQGGEDYVFGETDTVTKNIARKIAKRLDKDFNKVLYILTGDTLVDKDDLSLALAEIHKSYISNFKYLFSLPDETLSSTIKSISGDKIGMTSVDLKYHPETVAYASQGVDQHFSKIEIIGPNQIHPDLLIWFSFLNIFVHEDIISEFNERNIKKRYKVSKKKTKKKSSRR